MKTFALSAIRSVSACLTAIVLLLSGFSAVTSAQMTPFTALSPHQCNEEKVQIEKLLSRQAEAWNQGDLEQFMKTYWRSEELTFSAGGTTTYGWEATFKRYQKEYAPPREMGKLRFSEMKITILESKTALVLGNWHLTMQDRSERSGNYSLVMHKLEDQWRIIHDHSSELEPPAESAPDNAKTAQPGTVNGTQE